MAFTEQFFHIQPSSPSVQESVIPTAGATSLNTKNLNAALTLIQYRRFLKAGRHEDAQDHLSRRLLPCRQIFLGGLDVSPVSVALESGYIPTIRTVLNDYPDLLNSAQLSLALQEARKLRQKAGKKNSKSQMAIVNGWIYTINIRFLSRLEIERNI